MMILVDDQAPDEQEESGDEDHESEDLTVGDIGPTLGQQVHIESIECKNFGQRALWLLLLSAHSLIAEIRE